jgi:hypothetical protein
VPGQGVVVEGVKGVKSSHKLSGMYENGQFPTLIDLKIAKNAIFYLKVPKKIY